MAKKSGTIATKKQGTSIDERTRVRSRRSVSSISTSSSSIARPDDTERVACQDAGAPLRPREEICGVSQARGGV